MAAAAEPSAAPEMPNMRSIVTNANTDEAGSEQNPLLQLGGASRENTREYLSRMTKQVAEATKRIELVEDSSRFRLLAGSYDLPGVARMAAECIGEPLNVRPFRGLAHKPLIGIRRA